MNSQFKLISFVIRYDSFELHYLQTSKLNFDLMQSKYLPDGVSRGGTPFHGAPPGDANGGGGAGGDRDKNMFGEPL